ncbi:MAG: type II toxin-antitoxin system HipA family toxin, partial [Legionella sp.]
MNGNKLALNVYLGNNLIAELTLQNDQLHWSYSPEWQNSGFAVSPHLPLGEDIPSVNVQRFLRNMLPEGNGLEELVANFHLSKFNTFGLIQALGMDTPGALQLIPTKKTYPPSSSFRVINKNELQQRLETRNDFSLIVWDGKPRLSVAGLQDKINVVLNEKHELGFGEGNLCSTHILKFEKQKFSFLVLNEFISMKLAQKCGLNVANVDLMYFGQHPALLVERFDREFISISEVRRRHLIDGCQALNLPPEYKYERNFGSGRDVAHIRDGASLPQIFDFSKECDNPVLTKQQILDWVLFNLLIFNYDAHGKNISFFVGARGIALAPFYDLVNIKMYPQVEHELAMALGDEFDATSTHAYELADFADSCLLARSFVQQRLKLMIRKVQVSLEQIIGSMEGSPEEQAFL